MLLQAEQPECAGALSLEYTALQSDQTKFQGLLGDLQRAQENKAPHEASFSLMCELNELRDLPHHGRRLARRHCIEVGPRKPPTSGACCTQDISDLCCAF